MTRQAQFSYPGITGIDRGEMSVVHGVQPSMCSITVAPENVQGIVDANLSLGWQSESGVQIITWQGCGISRVTLSGGSGSPIFLQIAIADRRWRWKYGSIRGRYNLRDPNGFVKAETRKDARELCTLCLNAMGEVGYNLDAVPTNLFPEVVWDDVTPASALSGLAEEVGCYVVLSYTTNRVRLVKIGQGAELPGIGTGRLMRPSEGITGGGLPKGTSVKCGATRWQCRLALEAVGLDSDDTIKKVEDLSYLQPAGGGTFQWPTLGMTEAGPDDKDVARALKSVYRWYRIKGVVGPSGDLDLPGHTLTKIKQLQVQDHLLELGADGEYLPGNILGEYRQQQGTEKNTDPGTRWPNDWSLVKNNVVSLSEPCYLVENGRIKPANIQLETTVEALTDASMAVRYSKDYTVPGGNPTAPYQTVAAHQLHYSYTLEYSAAGAYTGVTDNKTEVETEMAAASSAKVDELTPRLASDGKYEGIIPIELDGAINQVTYSFGGGQAATTQASRNVEHSRTVPPHKERRRRERQNAERKNLDPTEAHAKLAKFPLQ